MNFIYGCDETGKCPVIGSIMIGIVKIDSDFFRSKYVKGLTIKDSKLTTVRQRNNTFNALKDTVNFAIRKIHPERMTENLIDLEVKEIINGLKELDYKDGETVYIDLFDSTRQKLIGRFVKFGFKTNFSKWVIKVRADSRYKVVSLASMFSKIHTDLEMETIKKEYPDVGNGNPSNLQTIKFLIEHYDNLPWFVRKTWLTITRIADPEYRMMILHRINEKLSEDEKTIADLYKDDSKNS